MKIDRVVVVGASAGGVESLRALVSGFPKDLAAPVFVVLHIPANFVSNLPEILSRSGPLKAVHPKNGEVFKAGRIYVAPPDHHLLIENKHVITARGPKENRNRPSIDALFRSAAYEYGRGAIGVILSGALDDGTSGLWSIKRLGGTSVIQDPEEAVFDSMPSSALEQVQIDHCISSEKMGALIHKLTLKAPKKLTKRISAEKKRLELEISIAQSGDAFRKGVMNMGPLSPFTCPECAGVLVEIRNESMIRFRCHTGHAYTASALLSELMDKVDSSYWEVMRSLEEAAMLLTKTGKELSKRGESRAAILFRAKAKEAGARARALRKGVLKSSRFSGDSLNKDAIKSQKPGVN